MTFRATLDRFIAELGVTLRAQPDWDESEVYLGATLEVAALPTVAAVERAFATIGFSCDLEQQRRNMSVWFGRCGAEKLKCVLRAATRGYELTIEWRSLRRPPISSGNKSWRGRSWPLFFDDANLYSESKTLLIVEGRIPATGFAACQAQYQRWATENEFAPHRAYEPDLGGDSSFADGQFVFTLQDRSPYVTLTVHPREEE